MAEESQNQNVVDFHFEFDKDYRIIAVNGIWGGATPRGQVQLDFFVERQGIPEVITNRLMEDGGIGPEVPGTRKPPTRLVRTMQVGILLTIEEAENVANFIRDRVAEIRKLKEKV
jgi:hypothetical protein